MNDFSLFDAMEYLTESNVKQQFKRYGLNHTVWFDDVGCERNVEHKDRPRLKYGHEGNFIPVYVCKEPYVIKKEKIDKKKYVDIFPDTDAEKALFDFIKRNLEAIIDHWYHRIDINALLDHIREVEEERLKDKKYHKRKYRRYLIDTGEIDDNEDDELDDVVDDSILAMLDEEDDE